MMSKNPTKYYDACNKIYDPVTHCAVENFDPDIEFAEDEFARVYFRINCPAYHFPDGFASESDDKQYYTEMREILHSFDLDEQCGNNPAIMEYLYIHPMELTGVVHKRKIRAIAESICNSSTAHCRSVDVYEDIAPITNEDFLELLKEKHDEIANDILSMFQTKRRDLFYGEQATSNLLGKIGTKYTIRRRQCQLGTDYTAKQYCQSILSELVRKQKMVCSDTVNAGIGYRTAKKGDFAAA